MEIESVVIIIVMVLILLPIVIKNISNSKKIKEMRKELDYSLQTSENMEFIFNKYLDLVKKDVEKFKKIK